MKKYVILGIVSVFLVLFSNCKNKEEKKETESDTKEKVVNKDEFTGELPELSIYNLPSSWTNQNGKDIKLEDLRGDIIVTVMIYTSCKASCPRLVADVRRVYDDVSDKTNQQVKYVFISIDPEVDTPERLKEFAQVNDMDSDQWIFLRGTEDDTREFASVLSVGYKKVSPIDFAHSNIISVFDQNGVLKYNKEGLDENIDKVVAAIEELAW